MQAPENSLFNWLLFCLTHTDYAEEKEIDVTNVGSILAGIHEANPDDNAEAEKLALIKLSKEDVELVISEMEVSKQVAETALREHNGSVVAALVALVNS